MKFFRREIKTEAEWDRLTIKRGSLLKKKRLLDKIDELRQNSHPDTKQLETDCYYIASATGENRLRPMISFLKAISDPDTITFNVIFPDAVSGDPLGILSRKN